MQVDRRRPGLGRAGGDGAASSGLIAVDLLVGAPLQLNTTFGYSVAVAGPVHRARQPGVRPLRLGDDRARRADRRPHRGLGACGLAIGLMAAVVVVEGLPMLGADVGGVLSMVPAFGVTALVLLGRPDPVAARCVALAVATGRGPVRCSRSSTRRGPTRCRPTSPAAPSRCSTAAGRRSRRTSGGAGRPAWAGPSWPGGSRSARSWSLAGLYAVLVAAGRMGPRATRPLPRPARRWPPCSASPCSARVGLVANDSSVAVPLTMLIVVAPAAILQAVAPAARDRGARGPVRRGRAGTRRGRRSDDRPGGAELVIPRPCAGLLHSPDAVRVEPVVTRLARARGACRARRGAGRSRSSSSWPARPAPPGPRTPTIPAGPTPASTGCSSSRCPGLTWAEVRDHDLPAIEGLLEDSALADMAPRGVSARSTPGAAYLTISAGTRAASDPLVDGQQLALGEQAGGSSAGDIFERRTGVEPDGRYVALSWPTLQRVNAREPYDAELGLLTDTLADAGLGVEAIGNADGTDSVGTSYERQVGLAAATGDGVIPAGELDTDLLVRDPEPAVRAAPRHRPGRRSGSATAWETPADRDGGLVIVEASDLARSMRYRDRVDERALRRSCERRRWPTPTSSSPGCSTQVDPERDAVMLLAPYNLPGDRDLTVSALRAPGTDPGYLRSASTQRSGFLTLVDVAPTVLDLLGVDRPVEMEGRPAEMLASGDIARRAGRPAGGAERGVALPRAAAVPDDAGRRRRARADLRGRHRRAGPRRRAADPAGRGVRRGGRPGGAADVVPRPRLSRSRTWAPASTGRSSWPARSSWPRR